MGRGLALQVIQVDLVDAVFLVGAPQAPGRIIVKVFMQGAVLTPCRHLTKRVVRHVGGDKFALLQVARGGRDST